jgi:hypothetical protein
MFECRAALFFLTLRVPVDEIGFCAHLSLLAVSFDSSLLFSAVQSHY